MIANRTERVRRHYDRNAASYDRIIAWAEQMLFGGGREWVCSRARGEVLEVAVGTGRNLPFYPEGVRLTGIELSPKMLDLARLRTAELGCEIDLRVGDAQNLPFLDASFDTVVATLALCTLLTSVGPWPKQRESCAPGGGCCSWNTSVAPFCPCGCCSASLSRSPYF